MGIAASGGLIAMPKRNAEASDDSTEARPLRLPNAFGMLHELSEPKRE